MELSEITKILNDVQKELLDTWDHKEEDFRDDDDYDQLQNFINGEYNARLQTKLDEYGEKLENLPENIQTTISITHSTFVETYLAKLGKKTEDQ